MHTHTYWRLKMIEMERGCTWSLSWLPRLVTCHWFAWWSNTV